MGFRAAGTLHEGNIINNSAANQTINNAITLDVAKHLITTQANALNLHGPITQTKNSVARFLTTGGAINLAGSGLANTNGILGGWAVVGNNAGFPTIASDWATLDGSNNVVPYTGYTDVLGDTGSPVIPDSPNANLRISNTTVTAPDPTVLLGAGVTRMNSLLFSAGTDPQIITIGAGNTLVLGQNGGIFNATAGNGGTNRNLTFDAAASQGTITAGDGVNPATITIHGANILPNNTGIMSINSISRITAPPR